MMDRLQSWFDESPRARPLLIFAGLGFFCLVLGIWSTAGRPSNHQPINQPPTLSPSPLAPMTSETPLMKKATAVWISLPKTPLYSEPGLNLPILKTLEQWQEVAWMQEQEGWDRIRLEDGTQGWVPNKFLVFARPVNLKKPNDAEVTVMAFYQAVSRKDFASAYAYLGEVWKSDLDFNRFVEGYSRTNSVRTEISQVLELGENRFQVDVAMMADELGREVPYHGSYVVEKHGEDWSLMQGSLSLQGSPKRNILPADPIAPATPSPPPSSPSPSPPVVTPELPEVEVDPTPTAIPSM